MKKFKTVLFYILSFTWGLPMTLIGSITMLIMLITKHEMGNFNGRFYTKVGKNWGGLELGCFFLTDTSPTLHIKQHESGHGIQNIVLGPFMLFVVCIPSAIRYWVMEMEDYKTKWGFVATLLSICALVTAAILSAGITYNILALIIVGGIIGGYTLLLAAWLIAFELPKYKDRNPDYDSIWFENSATKLGEKYFPEDLQ